MPSWLQFIIDVIAAGFGFGTKPPAPPVPTTTTAPPKVPPVTTPAPTTTTAPPRPPDGPPPVPTTTTTSAPPPPPVDTSTTPKPPPATTTTPAPKPPSDGSALVAAHNSYRARHGLPPLTMEPRLTEAAQGHASWMADTGSFSHTGAGGSSPFLRISQAGYSYSAAGENIALGQRTVEAVMVAWVGSPGHEANIRNTKYIHMGVGLATARDGRRIWVVTFGAPASFSFAPDSVLRTVGDEAGLPDVLVEPDAVPWEPVPRLSETGGDAIPQAPLLDADVRMGGRKF